MATSGERPNRIRGPALAGAGKAHGWHQKIGCNQLQSLVFARQMRDAQRVYGSTSRGVVPKPIPELPARWFCITRSSGLEIERFEIVDSKAQHQRAREALLWPRRRFPAQPFGHIATAVAYA